MIYLLDTDTCIYWLKGHKPVKEKLLAAGWNQVAISVITKAELYYGAHNSSRMVENLDRVEIFTSYLQVIPLDDLILQRFGKLKAHLRKTGQLLPDFDLLIASTALTTARILVTNNTRHHQRIPGLSLENWFSYSGS